MTRWLSAAAALALVLLGIQETSGQGRARIEGVVVASDGAAVPGATIDVRLEGRTVITTTTGADGQFRIDLAAGPKDLFEIRVSLPGFSVQTLEVGPSRRAGASTGLVNVKVRFGFLGETAARPPTRGRPPTATAPASPSAPLPPTTAPQPPASAGPAPAENHAIVKVFYATDRARMPADPVSYGGSRNATGTLHLGRFDVSVPRDHRMGSVERPTVLTLWREDSNKHFIIVNRVQQTYETFYDEVSALVRASVRKEAFVFIHGYNVTFESAIYRTAQFAYDLGFDGAPILYSWPSEGTEVGYPVDQNNNEWTVEHLRWFLEDVSARSGAEMIHLVAHSMGNRALTYALRQIATARDASSRPRFNQVVLTAPDIDLDTFTQLAGAIVGNLGQRITLYASSNDVALKLSKRFQGYQRAGDSAPAVLLLPGVDTVDVSAVDTSLLGHSYFGDNKSVLSDIFALIRDGKPPNQRFGLRSVGQLPRQWWVFSP